MTSNALSNRRKFIKRPIVCHPPPPPPPEPPPFVPGDISCHVLPADGSGTVGEDYELAYKATHTGLPDEDPVTIDHTTTHGVIEGADSCLNGVEDYGNLETSSAGVAQIKFVFQFSDTSICISFATATIEEENGNGDNGDEE